MKQLTAFMNLIEDSGGIGCIYKQKAFGLKKAGIFLLNKQKIYVVSAKRKMLKISVLTNGFELFGNYYTKNADLNFKGFYDGIDFVRFYSPEENGIDCRKALKEAANMLGYSFELTRF